MVPTKRARRSAAPQGKTGSQEPEEPDKKKKIKSHRGGQNH
jgi:hypothetical protein